MRFTVFFLTTIAVLFSCSDSTSTKRNGGYTNGAQTLFSKVHARESKVDFKNVIKEDMEYNFLSYPYLYTGGGIAIGDVDNDGLQDLFFVSNFGANKLYKNKGDFTFEDISARTKIEDDAGFSTGATMMDINNDGWMDIYVSKAGLGDDNSRRNKLFVNQKNGSFNEEAAKWGLDDPGYTTQVYQLDYDKDGDLDLYVVNYRIDFKNNSKISGLIQSQIEESTSDQLYRNDGTTFTKVTGQAGLYNKTWGLGAAIGDFNNDGWDDIYVANDFLEPDQMYINQKNGTYKNEILSRIKHISFNSMGCDYADLNNDLHPDLITLDMLAENYARSKQNMASMSTENFMNIVKVGYHHAYMANMLHMNTGNGSFKETSQLSGIVKTDWSWAPLIADFDGDGLKDIFISNGVFKDYTNQDFRNQIKEINARGVSMTLDSVLAMLPAEKLDNYIFKNNGDLTFSKKIKEWGLNDPNFSNGAAYADLDNDGDLDLVVNNINDKAGLYQNNSNENYLQVKLKGPKNNSLGIGAGVYIKTGEQSQFQELYLTRGFESSVTNILNFGLGNTSIVDEVLVVWPDGKTSIIERTKANELLTVDYGESTTKQPVLRNYSPLKNDIPPNQLGIDYVHKENEFDDYSLQLLLPQKQSTKGTGITKGDINGDGLEDFFVGNAAGAPASMYVQNTSGQFSKTNEALWNLEAKYEDANALLFDADTDGDLDLYVVSAGYELNPNSPLLQDRLYENDGLGNFSRMNALPTMITSGKGIASGDYDSDGDLDLFVGGNVIPGKYPVAPNSYLLRNENGKFIDVTPSNQDLEKIGMVSDAVFTDYDGDNDLDLMVVGEWMSPTIFSNTNGTFEKTTITEFDNMEGWWFSIAAYDFDKDGDEDYVFGNIGKNNKFHPSHEKPLYINASDFDNNGSFDVAMSKINDGKIVPVRGKECSSQQNPFLLDKIQTYKEFASLDMNEIYGENELEESYQLIAHTFKSVYAENLGNGEFKMIELPNESQLGPTLSFVNSDVNNDGNLDILGIGAIYDAEVETIRYDANFGYVLLNDGKGQFHYDNEYDPFIDSDAKAATQLIINGKPHYVIVSNNSPLQIFTYLP